MSLGTQIQIQYTATKKPLSFSFSSSRNHAGRHPATVAISLISLFVPLSLNLLALQHQDELSWDAYVFLCPLVTATFTPIIALITARCNVLFPSSSPRSLSHVCHWNPCVCSTLQLVPWLAGFPCGAAVTLLLKLVPVFWNEVLRSNGMRARVIRTEPPRDDIRILLSPFAALLLTYLEPIVSLTEEEGEPELQPSFAECSK